MGGYYGWYIVAIGMLVLMLVLGATINAFGLFVLPVSETFGLSRANMNTGAILLNFGMALSAPFVGRILDLYSARGVMAASAILLGASFIALGLSDNVWVSAAVLAVPLAMAVVGAGTLTSTALVARWFTLHRARAMAVVAIGMSLGSVVMAPLVGLLIEAAGWRQSLIILGCALTAVILLLVPFVRGRPGPNDVEAKTASAAGPVQRGDASHADAPPLKTGQLLKMSQFWTISLSAALTFGVLQAIIVSFVPLAQENGLSIPQSASLLSVVGVMAIVGKLVLAWLGDRVNRIVLLAGLFGLVAVTSAALLLGDGYASLLACGAFLGLVAGATTPAFLALLADRFGPASFGTANGTATFIMAIVGAACIRYGGEAFDRTGSYDLMFISFIAVGAISASLMFATRSLSRPSRDDGALPVGRAQG